MRRKRHKRTLDVERLEPKTSPATLLEAVAMLDTGADVDLAAQVSVEVVALSAPESLHWTCCPTSQEILQFVQTNTIECSLDSADDDYDFHLVKDDQYVAATDQAIELLSAAVLKAALSADQLAFS